MGREVHIAVLILLSIFEVWMCYQVLYRTVLDKKYLRTWQKVLIWVNILGVGTVLGVNRSMVYFSHTMFWIEIIVTALMASIANLKKGYVIFEVVVIYSSLIAILDFFFAFCGMTYWDNFWSSIYVYGNSPWKCFMYFLSRVLWTIVFFFYCNAKHKEKVLEVNPKFFLIMSCIFAGLIKVYQSMIYKIMNDLSNIQEGSAACSLIAVGAIMILVIGIYWENQNLKKEKQILEMREQLELEKIGNMKKVLEQKRIQVHDIRHHMIILKEYITQKNYSAIESYLNELLEEYTEIQEEKWTRVRSLDMVLCEKKEKAEKNRIDFKIKADLLKTIPFKETEVSVLFGNLLDNALEACEKIESGNKEIIVMINQRKGFLFISITNSIASLPLVKRGKFISDKKEKEKHGYGLKSVERIVSKYHGTVEYKIKKEKVTINMVFSIE